MHAIKINEELQHDWLRNWYYSIYWKLALTTRVLAWFSSPTLVFITYSGNAQISDVQFAETLINYKRISRILF